MNAVRSVGLAEWREAGEQTLSGIRRVVGVGDRAHHHYPGGAGVDDLVDVAEVDAADGEPGAQAADGGALRGRIAQQVGSHRCAARFRWRSPDRTDTEIVEVIGGDGGIHLLGGVGGQADPRSCTEQSAGGGQRQVGLADMKNRRAGEAGDIRSVIDRPEPGVTVGDRAQNLEIVKFLGRVDILIAQLDDVDPAGEGGIHEVGEIAAIFSGIGAEIQPGGEGVHATNPKGRCRGIGAHHE